MSLTTIVGALLAVVARPMKEHPWDRLEKVVARVEQLTRSQAKLVDHIERLERELALAQGLLEHWRDEAARLARQNREQRAMMCAAMGQQAQAQQNSAYQQAQQQNHLSQLDEPLQQLQYAQQNSLWCNCVPSRAQVWGQHGLVQQLNDNTLKE